MSARMGWFLGTLLVLLVFTNLAHAEPFASVVIRNNGSTVASPSQSGGLVASVFASHPEISGAAFGSAYASNSGFILSSSTISASTFGGGGDVAQASFGGGGGDGTPLGSYQVTSTTAWSGTFNITSTANYKFGFHVLNQVLTVDDPSAGAYATLGTIIKFNGETLYSTLASLTNDLVGDPEFFSSFLNPTGAAVPNFQSFDPGYWYSNSYDAFIDLGVLEAGSVLEVEYLAFTDVFSPEVFAYPNGGSGGEVFAAAEDGGQNQYVHARFGDPFGLNDPDDINPRLQSFSVEIPEPSSLVLICVGAMVVAAKRVRGRKKLAT